MAHSHIPNVIHSAGVYSAAMFCASCILHVVLILLFKLSILFDKDKVDLFGNTFSFVLFADSELPRKG